MESKTPREREPEPNPDLRLVSIILKPKGRKKRTRNREENIFSENCIMQKETLDQYEKLAKAEGTKKNAKLFMKKVYEDEGYKTRMSTIKRGNNGKNWMKGEEWICESLHYANKIYNAILKMNWVKDGNHGQQRTAKNRCLFITKKGTQCIRSQCSNGGVCSQHFKMSLTLK
ncbi:MAG: hypothetical protein CMG74_06815 [Candidatus Marinimicrobia bacterium]|nr:hypothetical protein [Candidatus Neomarinimicrobiota bacterium]|tara:strand:+ start:6281 stop:6796 length:516 start_codon:yes stop_codon:yes gene_type:complete